jgi:uncharacterized protein YcbX
MSTFRSGAHLGFKEDSDVFFGQNLLHETTGEVRVNDVFEVLRVKKAKPAPSAVTKKDD